MKARVAKKEYQCADCPNPIQPGQTYVPVNEYGEQRKLHVACADWREQKRAHA